MGNRLAEDSPRNIYGTRDGRWIGISASSQKTFERLAEAIGMPELTIDPRYSDNARRCENADELDGVIADWFRQHAMSEIMTLFEKANVVAGPVLDISDIFKDPQYQARENIVSVPDIDFGTVRMQGVTPRFLDTPGAVRHGGGNLGADNEEVLGRLGFESTELADLRRRKII
jgi:crotonobetainyl-CoA:carnitine CoA-transferase CaiB-like acyl-CoA transferase